MATCKTCAADILWVKKQDGWLPPFDMPAEMPAIEYVLVWSSYGVWQAVASEAPVETVALTQHKCPQPESKPARVKLYKDKDKDKDKDWEFMDKPTPVSDVKGILHDNVVLLSKLASASREIERLNDHERLSRLARRLNHKCPKCEAKSFAWCVRVNNPESETKQLHWER